MAETFSTKVLLLGSDKISHFVQLAGQCSFPVFLVSGHHRANGKSLIGIFSLDLTKSIRVEVECEEHEAMSFFADLAPLSADNQQAAHEPLHSKKERGSRFGLFGRR